MKIIIYEEVEDAEQAVDLLNYIAEKIKDGNTSGYHPGWALENNEDQRAPARS